MEESEDRNVAYRFFIDEVLTAVEPVSLRRALDVAADRMDSESALVSSAVRPVASASTRQAIGIAYHRLGDLEAAEHHLVGAHEGFSRELGRDHLKTLLAENSVAALLVTSGRYGEAETHYRRVLGVQRSELGPEHQETLTTAFGLALMQDDAGRYDRALSMQEEILELRRRTLGRAHPDTLQSMNSLAWTLLVVPAEYRDPARALILATDACELYGPEPDFLDTLARAHHLNGDSRRAVEVQRQALALLPPDETPLRAEFEAPLREYEAAIANEED